MASSGTSTGMVNYETTLQSCGKRRMPYKPVEAGPGPWVSPSMVTGKMTRKGPIKPIGESARAQTGRFGAPERARSGQETRPI